MPAPTPRKRVPLPELVLYFVVCTMVVTSAVAIVLVYPPMRQPAVLLLLIGLVVGFVTTYGVDVWRSRDIVLDTRHMDRPPVLRDGADQADLGRYTIDPGTT